MNFGRLRASRESKNPAPSDKGSDSVVDQIRRLGELRDAGLLSAEQFRVRRSQLLGRSI
jgi:Short C-terminal domain